MNELLRAVINQIIMGIYWFFAPHLLEKLPKPARIGCAVLGAVVILAFVGFVLLALIVRCI